MLKRILGKKAEDDSVYYKKSYAQDGEDMILDSILNDIGVRTNGFFVDVGAHHPLRFSNTAYFYNLGWRGINIEPTPDAISIFNEIRKRDINLNCGVSDVEGTLNFYMFDEPALNSFSRDLSYQRASTTSYNIIKEVKIPLLRLDAILDRHLEKGQHIDFFSIDVEGLDMQVLRSNNWDKYIPDFLFVEEVIDFEVLGSAEMYCFLKDRGYKLVAKTSRTLLYQHENVKY